MWYLSSLVVGILDPDRHSGLHGNDFDSRRRFPCFREKGEESRRSSLHIGLFMIQGSMMTVRPGGRSHAKCRATQPGKLNAFEVHDEAPDRTATSRLFAA